MYTLQTDKFPPFVLSDTASVVSDYNSWMILWLRVILFSKAGILRLSTTQFMYSTELDELNDVQQWLEASERGKGKRSPTQSLRKYRSISEHDVLGNGQHANETSV